MPLNPIDDAVRASVLEWLAGETGAMTDLLKRCIAQPSVSGQEKGFTEFIADWAASNGFETDLWQAKEPELAQLAPLPPKFIPLDGRPTLMIRLPGSGGGRSLVFNAHSDVVAAPQPERWRFGPWAGTACDGKVFGRGTCDVKGPLVSALFAMLAIRRSGRTLPGDVLLELVPGEEDSVGLGTLTSVVRGYKPDGAIILEPTESLPRCASRGGLRFEITCTGRAVHGTVKWLGDDAIVLMRRVLDALDRLEARWNDRSADALFTPYPIMRPITVDFVRGGDWQGMVCDRCVCAGYLELLPGDDISAWKERWANRLFADLSDVGMKPANVSVRILEHYEGHRTDTESPLCRTAAEVLSTEKTGSVDAALAWQGWAGFNSGCEAGLRAKLLGTPTLVWGPGSLLQAHAIDEFIAIEELEVTARRFADFALRWVR